MTKHSFSPKLTAPEARELGFMSFNWTEGERRWQWNADTNRYDLTCVMREHLADRGLLERGLYNVRDINNRTFEYVRFSLTRRGELMLARWQRQQADQRWRLNARERGEAA